MMNALKLTTQEVRLQAAYDQGYAHYPRAANAYETYSDLWKSYVQGFNIACQDNNTYWDQWKI